VARFHLGNGARLERLNWLADASERGLREAHGVMVNYRYDLSEIERNHEAYAQDGTVAASRSVRALLKSGAHVKGLAAASNLLALPSASQAKQAADSAEFD
jgi:malonyl-CoA decarboxylase